MNVRFATQLLSNSVANSLEFCKSKLALPQFEKCTATINFIRIFNDAFDILNSRQQISYGLRGSLNKNNFDNIYAFIQKFFYYIHNLKLSSGQPILKSQRVTGFLGLLVCFNSLLNLNESLIDKNKLQFLPFYKLSQDHLEIFFGSIRAHGGNNNNPTACQFTSAYKKLLVYAQIKVGGLGNCNALQDIPILNCSSISKNPINSINNSNPSIYKDVNLEPETHFIEKQSIHLILTPFTEKVTVYIAGFVSHKLSKLIKCDVCNAALFGNREDYLLSLIAIKDNGGLTYPSDDVVKICLISEKYLKQFYTPEKPLNKLLIKNKILSHFINNILIFSSIETHNVENGSFHLVSLIK